MNYFNFVFLRINLKEILGKKEAPEAGGTGLDGLEPTSFNVTSWSCFQLNHKPLELICTNMGYLYSS